MIQRATTIRLFFIILFLVSFVFILLRNAWLCDDAYISLRVVDNFVHGYGLTWNVAERVQAYTHPLWVFLIVPFYAVTREVYFTVIAISVALSLAAVAIYAFKIAQSTVTAILGLIALTLSAAFIDFSTSGLENPLTHFLLAIFLWQYFRRKVDIKGLFYLSLVAALAAVNRLDTLLLYIPMLVYAVRQEWGKKAIYAVLLGFLPLILWEIFSLVYYGFPFPNTAYAKLSTGLPRSEIWTQGIYYLTYSLKYDPVTIVILVAGIILPFVWREKRTTPAAFAVVLYVIYVVNIGGCFMSGRYLAAPLFVAVALLSQYRKIPWLVAGVALAVILVAGLTVKTSPVYAGKADQGDPRRVWHGIVGERAWYNPSHGLINYDSSRPDWPRHQWITEGKEAVSKGRLFFPHVAVGMVGFYARPQVFILDVYAITDPLLARLPVAAHMHHRIGHFGRIVPPGYKRTLETGKNVIADPSLAVYYDKLNILTRGEIFSFHRWWEIVKFNFGMSDHLIDDYLSPHLVRVAYEDVSDPRTQDVIDVFANNIVFYEQGLEIELGRVWHAPEFEISRDHNDGQRVEFYLGPQRVAEKIIPATPIAPNGVAIITVFVPSETVGAGYDRIMIIPETNGEGYHSIGHLRLLGGG